MATISPLKIGLHDKKTILFLEYQDKSVGLIGPTPGTKLDPAARTSIFPDGGVFSVKQNSCKAEMALPFLGPLQFMIFIPNNGLNHPEALPVDEIYWGEG